MEHGLRVAPRPLPANIVEQRVAIVAFPSAPREFGRGLRIVLAPLRGDVVERVPAKLTFGKFLRPIDRGLEIVVRKLDRQKADRVLLRFAGRHRTDKRFRAGWIVSTASKGIKPMSDRTRTRRYRPPGVCSTS